MIRINLAPTKKKPIRGRGPRVVAAPAGAAQYWLLAIGVGWFAMVAIGWWLLRLESQEESRLRKQIAAANQKVGDLKKSIDDATLQKRQAQVEQMEVAINKLNAKRRTPVYVMYELAMILTPSAEGGGPDIDQEKYRRQLRDDPQGEINERWDPTGLWISSMTENGGSLSLSGAARDATDLTEFTRRLRASARFGGLSNPDFTRKGNVKDDSRVLDWKLDAQVQRWD